MPTRLCSKQGDSKSVCLQSRGIPFLVFDVGGVLEMFDPRENKGIVVWEPTAEALTAKLSSANPNHCSPIHYLFVTFICKPLLLTSTSQAALSVIY